MLKISEIRNMSDDVLNQELEAARARLFHARFEAKTERNENAVGVRVIRREIAKMKTVANERSNTKKNAK